MPEHRQSQHRRPQQPHGERWPGGSGLVRAKSRKRHAELEAAAARPRRFLNYCTTPPPHTHARKAPGHSQPVWSCSPTSTATVAATRRRRPAARPGAGAPRRENCEPMVNPSPRATRNAACYRASCVCEKPWRDNVHVWSLCVGFVTTSLYIHESSSISYHRIGHRHVPESHTTL